MYDLNILCIMQEKKTKQVPFPSTFTWKVYHRGKNSFPKVSYLPNLNQKDKREYSFWPFMNSCCGFWYYLLPKEPVHPYCGCGEMVDVPYPRGNSTKLTNNCLPDVLSEYVSNLEPIWVKKKYMRDFMKIVDYFLSESPVQMIIFNSRCQGEERDIVNGVISQDHFFSMMNNRKIKENMCYIIKK